MHKNTVKRLLHNYKVNLKVDMQIMQYDMLEMEAKSWHEKKVYANELLVSFLATRQFHK